MDPSLPSPARFLRLGWRATRRVPGVWVARIAFEGFGYVAQLGFAFAVGLLFVIHFANHLESGLALDVWPATLLHTLGQPSTLIGLVGLLSLGWLVLFTLEAFVYAGMWSATRRALTDGADIPRWRAFWVGAFDTFARAVTIRFFVRFCEATLLVTMLGSVAVFASLAAASVTHTESKLLAPALTWAALLTITSAAVVIVRLTAELVAAAVYVDDVGLGEGLLRAAQTVVAHPLYVYRLFVVAAAVLIPPLCLAWLAALLQNGFVGGGLDFVGLLLRIGAEAAVLAGLAAFSVMLHATFFAYYAWERGVLEEAALEPRLVDLSRLAPQAYPHIANIDDILGEWPEGAAESAPARTAVPPKLRLPPPRPRGPERPYDINAILKRDEEE